MLARPLPTVNAARQPSIPGPVGGGKTAKAVKFAKVVVPLAIAAVGFSTYAGFIPMFGLAGLFSGMPSFFFSWKYLVATNALSVASVVAKKRLAKRQAEKAKVEEKARKEEAVQDLAPRTLEGEEAVSAVSAKRGADEGVSVYEFSTGDHHSRPAAAAALMGQALAMSDGIARNIPRHPVAIATPEAAPKVPIVRETSASSIRSLAPDDGHPAGLPRFYKTLMAAAFLSAPLSLALYYGHGMVREAGLGGYGFIMQHASNFYLGMAGISVFHTLYSAIYPTKRWIALTLAFVLNLVANIIEEIDLGLGFGRISRGASEWFGSDWIDFASGMLAFIVYAAVVVFFELRERHRVRRFARGR